MEELNNCFVLFIGIQWKQHTKQKTLFCVQIIRFQTTEAYLAGEKYQTERVLIYFNAADVLIYGAQTSAERFFFAGIQF